jgi:3-oxoacyl-[acyl-carrier protein] reductase
MDVVITGASQGIGKALAYQFAKKGSVNIFLLARSGDQLHKIAHECEMANADARVIPIPYDLDRIITQDLPQQLNSSHIDILINNAGNLMRKDFVAFEYEEIMAMIKTNFLVPAYLIRKTLGIMGGKQTTHVINIGSMAGFQGAKKFSGLSIYSASKAALASLTECLAEEFAAHNIFFNCLAIGSVQTQMLAKAFPGYQAPLSPPQVAEFIQEFALNGYKYFNGKILPVSITTP